MSSVRIEVVHTFDQCLIESLATLEEKTYPPRMRVENMDEYYRECLEDTANINVVMYDDDELIGYVVSIPHDVAYEALREYDPEMKRDPKRFYTDTIQTLPGKRKPLGILKMLYVMSEEAGRRGINKFSMHARTTNGLSRMIQRVFETARVLRTIENWYGYGEPFDYIEGEYRGRRR